MRLVRAIMFGVFLWLLVFFLLSAMTFSFGITYPTGDYFLIYFVFLLLFTLVCTLSYFWVRRMRGGFLHGLAVSLIFLVLMAILHLIVVVPFVTESLGFIYRWDTLVSYFLVLVIGVIVGISKG